MNYKKIAILIIVILIAGVSLLVLTNPKVTKLAAPVVPKDSLTIGYDASWFSLPILVAQDKGYFAEENLDVKLEKFSSEQQLIGALLKGSVQLGGYISSPSMYAVISSGKNDFYFTAPMIEDANHKIHSLVLPVNAPENLSYADLSGKNIGTLPTIAYKILLEEILKTKGVDLNSTKIVGMDVAGQIDAFSAKRADALFIEEPATSMFLKQGVVKLLNNEVELPSIFDGEYIVSSFNIKKEYADTNPEITKRLLIAIDKAIEFINQNPAEANQMLKNYLSDSQKEFVDSYPNPLYRTTAQTDPQAFQKLSDKFTELGILKNQLNIQNLVISKDFFSK